MMKGLITILVVVYAAIGVLLMIVEPRATEQQSLQASLTGKKCETDSVIAHLLLWPFLLNYYYGGGFDRCLSGSDQPTNN
jgi:hypothetical protein